MATKKTQTKETTASKARSKLAVKVKDLKTNQAPKGGTYSFPMGGDPKTWHPG